MSKAFIGNDGNVRKVEVQYKNPKPNEPVNKYNGRGYLIVESPVQRLIILLLMKENNS